jgi:hypothetical protein
MRLIEKNRADLERLKYTTDHKESKLEAENTAHFLALSYIPDLDDELEKEMFRSPMTPLFKTQPLDDMVESEKNSTTRSSSTLNESSSSNNNNNKKPPPAPNSKSDSKKSNSFKPAASNSSDKDNKKSSDNNKKNFIKRNIELAQEAGGSLAMTDVEKQRLNELLLDMDEFPKGTAQPEVANSATPGQKVIENEEDNSQIMVEYNPFVIQLVQGDGFTPDRNDSERLKHIDSVLERRSFSANSRYSSMMHNGGSKMSSTSNLNGSVMNQPRQTVHTIEPEVYAGMMGGGSETKQIKLNDDFDENQFGDKFIREARITREQELKLNFIEAELEKMRALKSYQQSETDSLLGGANSSSSKNNQFMDHGSSDHRSNGSTAVSLIDQQQLKELLEEFANESNQIVPFVNKNQ